MTPPLFMQLGMLMALSDIEYFSHVDKELGKRLREVTEAKVAAK